MGIVTLSPTSAPQPAPPHQTGWGKWVLRKLHLNSDATQPKEHFDPVYPCHCWKCHHEWLPRQAAPPKRCPNCQTRRWNIPVLPLDPTVAPRV